MLDQIISKLDQIDLSQVALKIVQSEIHVALDLNTEEQLFGRGIDSEGNSLGEYAPFTIELKKRKGQRYDHVTLSDERDFYQGFFGDTSKWPVTFYSKDAKADTLAKNWGSGIFGLTRDSTDQFTTHVQEPLAQACAQKIIAAFS